VAAQPTVDELLIAAAPDPWAAAGFRVDGDVCEVGTVRLRFQDGPGRGITAWSVRDLGDLDLDGLDTRASEAPPAAGAAQPNGVLSIDHLVVITPDLDRTAAVLQGAGLDLRRVREGDTPGGSRRQAFFRMGELILEVVEAPPATKIAADPGGPARLWGISFLVNDLDAAAAALGGSLGEPRAAVQPGRRIATAAADAGLGTAVAFMTPGRGAV
jgi:hypothetical protein